MKIDLAQKAHHLRNQVLEMCIKAGTGHVTSCFSCVEILVALFYGGVIKKGDRFLLSKGHASPLLYAILADIGYFPEEELWKFNKADGMFGVHLQHDVPGVLTTSGSLGYGLGIGAGMALADKGHRVFVLLGDGECYEGSVWESVMFAGQQKLSNLTAIIDYNKLMVTAPTNLEPLGAKWQAFGWYPSKVNGHSIYALQQTLMHPPTGFPLVVIADTIKGKGATFMENNIALHGKAPKGRDAEEIRRELNGTTA